MRKDKTDDLLYNTGTESWPNIAKRKKRPLNDECHGHCAVTSSHFRKYLAQWSCIHMFT